MEQEILNIEHHIKIMILKALNKTRHQHFASKLLGISDRSLHRYKKNFGIVYNRLEGVWMFREPIKVKSV